MSGDSTSAEKRILDEDVKILHHMGYAQELARRMGGFSNFAISFSIICILAGGITAFPVAFIGRRRRSRSAIGWLIGGAVRAGRRGLAWRRSPRPIRPPAASTTGPRSWAAAAGAGSTAWINMLGLIFVVASVNVGVYLLFQRPRAGRRVRHGHLGLGLRRSR